MKKFNLEFCFKGDRTYVQGPDILDAVLKVLNNDFDIKKVIDIKYSAHNMLHSNADLIITEHFQADSYPTINSMVTFKVDDKKYYAIVTESDKKIECSNTYTEEIVRNNATIDGSKIVFKNTLDDSLSEIIVSMNKYFLQKTVTKDAKWIVTKIEYKHFMDFNSVKESVIELTLTNNFNNKLTKSTIKVNDKDIGHLYFSLI